MINYHYYTLMYLDVCHVSTVELFGIFQVSLLVGKLLGIFNQTLYQDDRRMLSSFLPPILGRYLILLSILKEYFILLSMQR